jgi:hypothetical protein
MLSRGGRLRLPAPCKVVSFRAIAKPSSQGIATSASGKQAITDPLQPSCNFPKKELVVVQKDSWGDWVRFIIGGVGLGGVTYFVQKRDAERQQEQHETRLRRFELTKLSTADFFRAWEHVTAYWARWDHPSMQNLHRARIMSDYPTVDVQTLERHNMLFLIDWLDQLKFIELLWSNLMPNRMDFHTDSAQLQEKAKAEAQQLSTLYATPSSRLDRSHTQLWDQLSTLDEYAQELRHHNSKMLQMKRLFCMKLMAHAYRIQPDSSTRLTDEYIKWLCKANKVAPENAKAAEMQYRKEIFEMEEQLREIVARTKMANE